MHLYVIFAFQQNQQKLIGGRTRNYYYHDTDRWDLFKAYCMQDVRTEQEVAKKLSHIQMPETEYQLWVLDTYMNTYGALVDKELVDSAINVSNIITEELMAEAVEISGLNNPNSVAQLKKYLEEELGEEVTSLNKDDVPKIIESTDNEKVTRLLQIRQELGKTSVKKYMAMKNAMGTDNRVRGLLQYYGANRTGRWARSSGPNTKPTPKPYTWIRFGARVG